jgi:hypothetical protein
VILEMDLEGGGPVGIDAFTLVVNAHGGLLELRLPLRAGQKLSIVHPVSGTRKSSKVVELRRSQDSGDFVTIARFSGRKRSCETPHYWKK